MEESLLLLLMSSSLLSPVLGCLAAGGGTAAAAAAGRSGWGFIRWVRGGGMGRMGLRLTAGNEGDVFEGNAGLTFPWTGGECPIGEEATTTGGDTVRGW